MPRLVRLDECHSSLAATGDTRMVSRAWTGRLTIAAAGVAALACWASWGPAIHAAQERGRGAAAPAAGGGGGRGRNSPPLPALPLTFETTAYRIRVSLVSDGRLHRTKDGRFRVHSFVA